MKRGIVLCVLCILFAAVHVRAAAANMYYYDQLGENAKYVYDLIDENRATIFSKGEIVLERETLDMQDCKSAAYAFRLDHPEVFWLGRSLGVSSSFSSSYTKYDAGLPSGWEDFLGDSWSSSSSSQTIMIWDPVNGWTSTDPAWDVEEWSGISGDTSNIHTLDWFPSGQEIGTSSKDFQNFPVCQR